MYLLYVDESGRPGLGADTHLVVAGLAIHEADCYPLARSLRSVQKKWVGAANADLELHATDIWSGRKEWARVDLAVRRKLIRGVFTHLANWESADGRSLRFFGAAVHKPSFPKSSMERAHEELLARFDEFLTRLHHAGDSHRSLVVADDSSYERILQSLAPRWMAGTERLPPLHSLVEVPLYVDSKASRLVQAADFIAWAIWQYYENGHTEHIQKLNDRFDADGGIQHGLVHLSRGYRSCTCIPCESRRTRTTQAVVPPRR